MRDAVILAALLFIDSRGEGQAHFIASRRQGRAAKRAGHRPRRPDGRQQQQQNDDSPDDVQIASPKPEHEPADNAD